MSALAELLADRGIRATGSDTDEAFYTQDILKRLDIPYSESFSPELITPDIDLVVHSAAYSTETHPQLLKARELGLPIVTYPECLGELSKESDASGVSGVHGKSTTTAIIGTLLEKLSLRASVLTGTAVPSFGGRSTVTVGTEFFIAETCEWRRHFLKFRPDRIVITNVELDHTDYFASYDDILNAFIAYAERLPTDGELIYCADDPGAVEVADILRREKPRVQCFPYGTAATGAFRILFMDQEEGGIRFRTAGGDRDLVLRVPGFHNVLNATAAIALVSRLVWKKFGSDLEWQAIADGIEEFRGSKRRSEIIGERDGILFIDDYGHHPSAITATLEGYRAFYPGRRIILDFMSHTYSRTEALFSRFVDSFNAADVVLLHKIYASARERAGTVDGRDLFEAVSRRRGNVYYFDEILDALPYCRSILRNGDVFITMGAGDNWKLGKALAEDLKIGEAER